MQVLLVLNFRQRNATRLATILSGVFALILFKDSVKACLILGAALALLLRNPTFVYAFGTTIKRDIVAGYRFVRLNLFIMFMERRQWAIARIFQERAKMHPQKPCFIMDDRSLSFQWVEDYTNKVGAYFKARGLQRGDSVALIMETRPEYVCLWLGLSKIGVVTALINSHLRRETLLHSIHVANAQAIIVGTELTKAFEEIYDDIEIKALPVYQYSDDEQRDIDNFNLLNGAIDLSSALQVHPVEDLSASIALCNPKDKLLYVYTSGTTGMPKAAVINNLRYLFMASGIYHMLALKTSDVIYNPLPLYHTAGGILGIGNALVHGCTIAMRKKFSASNFWKDCIKYDCTVAQYIGELCRYLLSTPPKPEDTQHRLRLMYGNGLRPQIWSQFVSRFNIPNIGEVYGSTEGNSNLANMTNQVGAVGFVPLIGRYFYPVQIIKCDEETGEPIRNANGYCQRCSPGETGLLIGKVNPRRAATAFNGYADKKSSEKKLLRNAFREGDLFFNSGDMVVGDILGYFYFKDRTGDTFRWRGENVATQEVEAIITNIVGLQDCVVYGVDVPYVEGKAGMAAIVDPDRKVDMQHLSAGVRGSLPAYARPLFIRLMNDIPRTATFKLKKRELVREAFDIHRTTDPIYYLNKDGIYRLLTQEQFEDLLHGKGGL
ncbi:long-chain fatty acid transport protein 4 [Anastrepha ludens]|uniref:long-chain fatty acid transport protein 4 n=1 Tax=Anastrepha ludens TaxID=28586 RepID=UPI0023B085F0|nr:long-chain fatty acid transport protein 4 [Anastrepha ludens]XP_053963249.1 long-chain fatty acid transport protein 4 [Anastrepha ludens]XP_053963250.1 long-chain fatty acid transport protein 4 [Anastrepha ludens]